MGEKNKGRPKRHGERRFPAGGAGGRPPRGRDDRKGDQPGEHRRGQRGERRGPEERADAKRWDAKRADGKRAPHDGTFAKRRAPADGERGPRSFEKRGLRDGGERFGAAPAPDRAPSEGAPADRGARRGAPRFDKRRAPPEHEGAPASGSDARPERLWIYGRHAAIAAIVNPQRKIKRILVNESALEWINDLRVPRERLAQMTKSTAAHIDAALHAGAVHQGIAIEVEDLPRARLKEDCQPDGMRPVVVLDQITDPHNIGAIFRSAAAFNARAIVVQDRRTPPLAGALAKAAAGAVEAVPCVQAVNIARSLEGLKALGYFCAGLAGESAAPIATLPKDRPVALVLGAEGAGLRKLVRDTCDAIYAIPMARGVDSLNVSNASAVALYEIARQA